MPKRSLKFFSLMLVGNLSYGPHVPLVPDSFAIPEIFYNLGTQPVEFFQDSIAKTTQIEISVSRRQATLYQGETKIKSYPVAVGRPGWETPLGSFQVEHKIRNPTWIHPLTGETVPGGDPENPLGRYWIGFWTDGKNWVGLHGTPTPKSVGTAASHGCVRMYNKDIEELFGQVQVGTPVIVVQ